MKIDSMSCCLLERIIYLAAKYIWHENYFGLTKIKKGKFLADFNQSYIIHSLESEEGRDIRKTYHPNAC